MYKRKTRNGAGAYENSRKVNQQLQTAKLEPAQQRSSKCTHTRRVHTPPFDHVGSQGGKRKHHGQSRVGNLKLMCTIPKEKGKMKSTGLDGRGPPRCLYNCTIPREKGVTPPNAGCGGGIAWQGRRVLWEHNIKMRCIGMRRIRVGAVLHHHQSPRQGPKSFRKLRKVRCTTS